MQQGFPGVTVNLRWTSGNCVSSMCQRRRKAQGPTRTRDPSAASTAAPAPIAGCPISLRARRALDPDPQHATSCSPSLWPVCLSVSSCVHSSYGCHRAATAGARW